MDSFEILGIEKTDDIKEIRRAYSKLLTKYSPEKDPEGFQRLRAAYENALSIAKNLGEETEENLSPVDKFMEEFQARYKCFEKRIDIDSWRELLEKDICYNIDTSKEISSRILAFLMDNYNFPSNVWSLFNNYFSWTSKKEQLSNEFPANFINFVMYKINNESTFDYEFLKNCNENEQDLFIAEFRKIDDAIYANDLYNASTSINSAKRICEDHPNLLILIGRYLVISGQLREAEKLFSDFINKYPDEINGYYYRGELYSQIGNLKEAYNDYNKILIIDKECYGALNGLVKTCICLKEYEKAIEYVERISDKYAYRDEIMLLSRSANNFYIDSILENDIVGDMSNNQKFKLAKSYYKTGRRDESAEILKELMQSFSDCSSEVFELYCKILIEQNNTELAGSTVCKGLDLFENSIELNFIKADILDSLGKIEMAVEQYDKVIELSENHSIAYNNKSYELNKLKRYNEALECANKSIELEPSSAHTYKNKAISLLGLELYSECLDATEQAINKYQYLSEAYAIKMEALIAVNYLDEALAVYNKAAELGLRDAKLYYQKSRALMYMERYKESISCIDSALELEDKNSDYYYVKGLSYYYIKEYDNAIDLFNSAIDYDNNNGGAYFYKVRCLLNTSRDDEACETIDSAIKLNIGHLDKFYNFKGFIFGDSKKYEDAISQFEKAIEIEPTVGEYYYSAGRAYSDNGNYDKAIEYYKKSIELDPETIETYVNISYCYYNMKNYHSCIEYCTMANEIDDEYSLSHQNKGWAYYQLGDLMNAQKELDIALRLDGNNEDVLLLKLRILTKREQHQEALLVCDRMLEINKSNEDAIKAKKQLLDEMKKQKKGLLRGIFG